MGIYLLWATWMNTWLFFFKIDGHRTLVRFKRAGGM